MHRQDAERIKRDWGERGEGNAVAEEEIKPISHASLREVASDDFPDWSEIGGEDLGVSSH